MKPDKATKSNEKLWLEHEGSGPLVATAIHSGHEIRRDLLPMLALDDSNRPGRKVPTLTAG